jgi:sugar lactone lactonase YvrE
MRGGEVAMFETRLLLPPHSFTAGIEGPACDGRGNFYAVNFAREGSIGLVTPEGQGRIFVQLPEGSVGNGIRFDRRGGMLVADYTGHQILRVDMTTRDIAVHAKLPGAWQPNDLCILDDGTVFASDPNWNDSTGRVWRVDPDASSVRIVAEGMGTTNGIEPSPDNCVLYVNESVQRRIWAFDITPDGLTRRRLFAEFPDHGLDGMRVDVAGFLWVTRYGAGTVVCLDASGAVVESVRLRGSRPSNLCFGGPDGRTVHVTEVDQGTVELFRAPRPGREWALWQCLFQSGTG